MCCLSQKLSGSTVGEGKVHVDQGPGWGPLLCLRTSILCLRMVKGAERVWGEGYLEKGIFHPTPTPCSLQQVFSWGAEAIESELDLIALLMTNPHFSIDLASVVCRGQPAIALVGEAGEIRAFSILTTLHSTYLLQRSHPVVRLCKATVAPRLPLAQAT